MKNEMQVFEYQGKNVRTVEKDGEIWWVLTDVCRGLEITNHKNVSARLDEDEKGVHLVDTLGGAQKMTIISESGLYKAILRSDKPKAKEFTRWVTHEVLPTIRKTGGYGQSNVQSFSMEQMVRFAAEVATQVATQIIPVIVSVVKAVLEETRSPAPPPQSVHQEYEIPQGLFHEPAPNQCKVETFPQSIREQVDAMIDVMQQEQALNYSRIARFCTLKGYSISSPSIKRYYDKHHLSN